MVASYSQAEIGVREDMDSATADANNEMTEDDTQWKAIICRTLDRKHVNKLLDHSDASFSEEFSNQLHVQSGWEEAVQGWSGCSPMFCLFQLQKKCKKAKTGDNDYHCLLCVDVKLEQNPEPDLPAGSESSEANCSLAELREDKSFGVPTKYQRRPSSSPSAICCPSTELHSNKHQGKATNRAEIPNKVTNEFQEIQKLSKATELSPLDKEKEAMENLIPFPPQQRSSFPWSTMEVNRRSVRACSPSTTDSLTAENGSYGIPVSVEMCDEGEEGTAGPYMDTKVSEDNYVPLTPKYRRCHSSKNLLSAFSISIPRNYVTCSEALPQATNLLTRKVKYDNEHKMSTKSHQGYRTRRTEPNLPILFGTRVPILSASHRILYPNV